LIGIKWGSEIFEIGGELDGIGEVRFWEW